MIPAPADWRTKRRSTPLSLPAELLTKNLTQQKKSPESRQPNELIGIDHTPYHILKPLAPLFFDTRICRRTPSR
jgi:hypothetical protein